MVLVHEIRVENSNFISVSNWQISNISSGKHFESTTQITLAFDKIARGFKQETLIQKLNSARFRVDAQIRQQNVIK